MKIDEKTKRKILLFIRRIRNIKSYIWGRNKIINKGKGNSINRDYSDYFKDTKIKILGNNNVVQFGKNCNIVGLNMLLEGDNNKIIIGDDVGIVASAVQPTVINAFGGRRIDIGSGCLLSNNIEIHTSDYHGIYDMDSKKRVNHEKDIVIKDNVWIGLRTVILKGTEIPDGCVIGANSLLAGKYLESNSVMVGNPARIVKKNVCWDHDRKEYIK